MNFRTKLGAVFICIALFLIFLFFRFPFKNIRGLIFSKIYQATRIFIVSDDLYPSLFGWPGVAAKNVDVTFPVGNGDLGLSCHKIVVRVGIGQVFPPAPSVSLSLEKLKKGGNLFLKFFQTSDKIAVRWESDALALQQLMRDSASAPEGILDSEGSVDWNTADATRSTGVADLKISLLKTPAQFINMAENYGFLIPALNIGPIKTKIFIKNGIAEINSFEIGTKDSDIRGTIAGDIKLAKNPLDSFLNLTIKLQLAAAILSNPQAEAFVSFLGGYKTSTPGDYAMRWSLSLRELETPSINVLPKPLN